jgi:hypothetical protein
MDTKKPTKAELKKILELHRKWWFGEEGGVQANLRSANLRGADLGGANLRGADLGGANLRSANLRSANLRSANLRGADLGGADLGGADLGGANLGGANLGGANLTNSQGLQGRSLVPQKGSFTAFKKVCGGVVLELLIPEDAERVSSYIGRKCRASKALVVRAIDSEKKEFVSMRDGSFVYRVGEVVVPDAFNGDRTIECTSGIHFFIEQGEAEAY